MYEGGHIMTWAPGWNSVSEADGWSNFFFWFGIFALFLLLVFEAASHIYTLRKDELVAQRQDATQRSHDEEMARLHLEAAKIGEKAAGLEKEAAEAKLQLEKLRTKMGPRQIDSAIFLQALEAKPKTPVEIMFPKEDGEAFMLAIQFRDLLRVAKWEAAEPVPVPATDIPRLANQPSHMAVGAQATGVAVVVRADTQDEFNQVSDFQATTPMNALRAAITNTLGGVAGYAGGADIFPAPPRGTVRIVVGPKP